MSNVTVSGESNGDIPSGCPKDGEKGSSSTTPAPGGDSALWETLYTVSTSVTNTGKVAGATVPQLYLGLPQPANEDVTPVKVLRGFEKVSIQPNQTTQVSFDILRRDLSNWDTASQNWVISPSPKMVYVGASSRNLQLSAALDLSAVGGGESGAAPQPPAGSGYPAPAAPVASSAQPTYQPVTSAQPAPMPSGQAWGGGHGDGHGGEGQHGGYGPPQ